MISSYPDRRSEDVFWMTVLARKTEKCPSCQESSVYHPQGVVIGRNGDAGPLDSVCRICGYVWRLTDSQTETA